MVDIKSGPVEFIRGIVEDVFGKAKEVIGTIIGRNDLINEGKTQQDKADAQRNAGAEGSRRPRRPAPRPRCTRRVSGPSSSKRPADRAGPVTDRARFAL